MSSSINARSLIYGGNRILIRRQEDRKRQFFVDQYSPKLFAAIVVILFLCVLDALLTLFLLNHGAYETNPIMAYLLNIGPYAFYFTKYAITIIATFGLLMFRGMLIQKFNLSVHSLLSFPVHYLEVFSSALTSSSRFASNSAFSGCWLIRFFDSPRSSARLKSCSSVLAFTYFQSSTRIALPR